MKRDEAKNKLFNAVASESHTREELLFPVESAQTSASEFLVQVFKACKCAVEFPQTAD
jgi:hypothetical protein